MVKFTQANRPLSVTTPLGPDALLLEKIEGAEALSRPFRFQLQMLAEKAVSFEPLMGQAITVTLKMAGGVTRYFHGIVRWLEQGPQVRSADGNASFIRYAAEIVPAFALLARNQQSRIFQHEAVPAILKTVLSGFAVKFQLGGAYKPRDFCVQYAESDFHFASRLMEEEGIFYYFEHGADGHTMVVADSASGCPTLPQQSTVIYDEVEGGKRSDLRITAWKKTQRVRAGKCQVRDYCFQLPDSNLEAQQAIPGSASVGSVSHNLASAASNRLNVYLGYGSYAKRYDDTDSNGGSQAGDLSNIFQDNQSVARLRMEHEAARSLKIRGAGNCAQLTPGYHFTLQRHFDADGSYLLTRVDHLANIEGTYTTATGAGALFYENHFHCQPAGLVYRPPLRTERPFVGPQTAKVVGPAGEEIFCDKYGRIKVQFYWDLQGQNNPASSCWLRVCQPWAGTTYGSLVLPRVGQEVLVAFEQGDPDQPIVIAGLYNAKQMPPYNLPGERRISGIVTSSGPSATAYHELHFNDTPGQEMILLHSEKDMQHQTEHNMQVNVGGKRKTVVGQPLGSGSGGGDDSTDDSGGLEDSPAEHKLIYGNQQEVVYGSSTEVVEGAETTLVVGNDSYTVEGAKTEITVGLATELIYGGVIEAVTPFRIEAVLGYVIETITGNVTSTTTGNVTETTIGNITEIITGNASETRAGNVTENILGNIISSRMGNVSETITGNVMETTTGEMMESKSGIMRETKVGTIFETVEATVYEAHTGQKFVNHNGTWEEEHDSEKAEQRVGPHEANHDGAVTTNLTGAHVHNHEGDHSTNLTGAATHNAEGAAEHNQVGAESKSVEGDVTHVVDGAFEQVVDGAAAHVTTGDHSVTVGGAHNVEVAGDSAVTVAGAHTVEVAGVSAETVAGAKNIAAAEVSIEAGVTTIATGGLMITP